MLGGISTQANAILVQTQKTIGFRGSRSNQFA